MQLAFLAPKIVEMVAAGRQPPELTEALAERIDLPLLWTAGKSRGSRLVGSRSISSSHFG
jgi:hypothetical protein